MSDRLLLTDCITMGDFKIAAILIQTGSAVNKMHTVSNLYLASSRIKSSKMEQLNIINSRRDCHSNAHTLSFPEASVVFKYGR